MSLNQIMSTVYVITGWTENIGTWEPEVYLSLESAQKAFNDYVLDYEATYDEDEPSGLYYAQCPYDEGSFWINECEVIE